MKIDIDNLVEKVKVNMEELTPSWEDNRILIEGLGTGDYIRSKLPEAIRQIYQIAPPYVLPKTEGKGICIPKKRQDGSGEIILPIDFLRMISFRMRGWRRPVNQFISQENPRYELQFNTATRGGTAKPVCIIKPGADGQTILDYYSLPPYIRVHEIEELSYIALPVNDMEAYAIPALLIDPICYTCAAMVYNILAKPDMATLMIQQVQF